MSEIPGKAQPEAPRSHRGCGCWKSCCDPGWCGCKQRVQEEEGRDPILWAVLGPPEPALQRGRTRTGAGNVLEGLQNQRRQRQNTEYHQETRQSDWPRVVTPALALPVTPDQSLHVSDRGLLISNTGGITGRVSWGLSPEEAPRSGGSEGPGAARLDKGLVLT